MRILPDSVANRHNFAIPLLLFSSLLLASITKFECSAIELPDEAVYWAQYSPFFPVVSYSHPPQTCLVTQVNLLQRHGARWPTSGAWARQASAVTKLQNSKPYTDPKLDFLDHFVYNFGIDDLLLFGATQSRQTGTEMYYRYETLLNSSATLFVRSASSQRVVDSATFWMDGLSLASEHTVVPTLGATLLEEGNCTLCNQMCPNQQSGDESATWLSLFAPGITRRLNEAAPGANLDDDDTLALMDICPFDSLNSNTTSPFCDLFTPEEFATYEYYYDLDKYYDTGPGNTLGRVQGVGYVNELLARLTGQPVEDQTQTNCTLDADPQTFPLNRTFYADFSHDNTMVPIYAALGLFNDSVLDPRNLNEQRTWVNSRLVPFSGRMTVEKLVCAGTEAVRVLVNDAVQPLEFCHGVQDGVCELSAFVDSQVYARQNGQDDFDQCGFIPSTNSGKPAESIVLQIQSRG